MNKEILEKIKKEVKSKEVIEWRSKDSKTKQPKSFGLNGSRKTFTPDLVAVYENKQDLFAVENKIVKAELPNLISKWILFGLEARKARGNFYVVVAKKYADQCKALIESKQLSAEVITL